MQTQVDALSFEGVGKDWYVPLMWFDAVGNHCRGGGGGWRMLLIRLGTTFCRLAGWGVFSAGWRELGGMCWGLEGVVEYVLVD